MQSCPHCETLRKVELVTRKERVTMKGKEITFKARSYKCIKCNEEFDTAETLDKNLVSARKEYDILYKRDKNGK